MPSQSDRNYAGWFLVTWWGLAACGVMAWVGTIQFNDAYNDSAAIHWALVGALTSTTATFRIRNDPNSQALRTLALSAVATPGGGGGDFGNPVQSITIVAPDNGNPDLDARDRLTQTIVVENLQPTTRYYYRFSSLGATDVYQEGQFRTPAAEGTRFNFSLVTAGCAWSFSDHDVFRKMAQEEADLFVHLGDLHYEDIGENDLNKRIQAIDKVLGTPSQRQIFSTGGLVYMWDDHDWLGDDSGRQSGEAGARDTALESYQIAIPHYPLALGSAATIPVYHSFTYGTVRFILSDLRSEATDDSIYSATQREWLRNELLLAGSYDWVVWISTRPWIGTAEAGSDMWAGYATNRSDLSTHISTVVGNDGPQNLIALASDAHMVAMDDGTNTYYGSNTESNLTRSFPILQSGPLDRFGSNKGGPYTEGCHTTKYKRNHQYSHVSFVFGEGNVEPCIDISTYRITRKGDKETIFRRELCGNIFAATEPNVKRGSCDMNTFETRDILLFAFSLNMWLLIAVASYCLMGMNWLRTTLLMLLMLLFFCLIYGIGIGIPWLQDVKQFDIFPMAIIGFGYMGITSLSLALLICVRMRFQPTHDYHDDDHRPGEERHHDEVEEETDHREDDNQSQSSSSLSDRRPGDDGETYGGETYGAETTGAVKKGLR